MISITLIFVMVNIDAVGHARALAEEGQSSRSPNASVNYDAGSASFQTTSFQSTNDRDSLNASFSSLQLPPSPNRRISLGVGGKHVQGLSGPAGRVSLMQGTRWRIQKRSFA